MPSLQDLTEGRSYPLLPGRTFFVGRRPDADLPVRDLSCSRQQFAIRVAADSTCCLQPLSTTSPTFCEGMPIHAEVELDRDVEITAGRSKFRFSLAEADPSERPPASVATVVGGGAPGGPVPPMKPLRIEGAAVIGREPSQTDILLPHVQVSRRHARITLHRDGAILVDLGSSGGTFLNGRRIHAAQRVNNGDTIGIGPYQLTFDSGFLAGATREDNLQLVARGLCKTVRDPGQGNRKPILQDVSLVVRPREFVCLLGPAGCGKSTLLSALSARAPADSGRVTLNGSDLYGDFERLKHDLAFVPQRDLLHANLTVEQALRYTARLRLPRDASQQEVASVVVETMEKVGLLPQRGSRIAHLSGGQTKRTSLAMEILANPSLIFLDEVTSGLDERSDREMMQLLRRLADDGKTLLCVTHNLANVPGNCHLVVILAESGCLAFVGRPEEALAHFGVERLGDIYEKLREQTPHQWRDHFLRSDSYAEYVGARLAAEPTRAHPGPAQPSRAPREPVRALLRQTPILLARYGRLLLTDRLALTATVGQCLLVAALLVIVFGDITDTGETNSALDFAAQASGASGLLFITAISCLWFGCNGAAKEIVKERAIFLQEQRVGLNAGSYYLSKLLPLCLLSVLQALLLYGMVGGLCRLPGAGLAGALTMSLLAVIGVTLGLAISALARTEEMATAMVPAVLIPQIILSGGLKPLDGLGKLLAQVGVSAYWGYGLLRGTLPAALADYLAAPATAASWSLAMLLAHGIVFASAALLALGVKIAAPK